MQHRRLKQKHWSNTKHSSSKNLNSLAEEENSTTCHIKHSSRTNSDFTTEVSSKLQQEENFSSNLHFKQHSKDEEEENFNTTTTSHCNVSQNSPYLFHFLVLVLLTFAQIAGKKTHYSVEISGFFYHSDFT